jgi:hypothetical protein
MIQSQKTTATTFISTLMNLGTILGSDSSKHAQLRPGHYSGSKKHRKRHLHLPRPKTAMTSRLTTLPWQYQTDTEHSRLRAPHHLTKATLVVYSVPFEILIATWKPGERRSASDTHSSLNSKAAASQSRSPNFAFTLLALQWLLY